MAKREISSTLKNLKFMQRAAQREEKIKQVEEVVPSGNFSPSGIVKKCVVVMEGDPHPGLSRGRMSFQCFNPSIDKLNEEACTPTQAEASTPHSGNQNGKSFVREDESTQNGRDNLELNRTSNSADGDLKRKQPEVAFETPSPNKLKKNFQSAPEARRGDREFKKQPKGQKLDWNVLRPPKSQKKTE